MAGDNIQPYKAIIERWVCPDVMGNQLISVAKAKKAISDYKKAVGSPEDIGPKTADNVLHQLADNNLLSYLG